ncbi:hypothetical protein QTP88_020739 [Uroleucon formosanum]
MVGRKLLTESSEIVAAVIHFKERVVTNNNGENRSKKRKTQRTEVLTTTIVKNIQFEKMKNAERKIKNTLTKRPTRKSVRKSLNFESTKKKVTEDTTQYFCSICSEKYVCRPGGKPVENWIQ